MSWPAVVASALADNRILERLCFASLELVVLTLVLLVGLRWARPSSMRLVACLWLIVLAKPMVTLAIGAPVTVLHFAAPVAQSSPAVPQVDPIAPEFPMRGQDALVPASAFASGETSLHPTGPIQELSSTESKSRLGFDPSAIRFESWLLAAWALGVVGFGARYLLVRRRLRQIVRRARRAPRPVEMQFAAIATQIGLARRPVLRVTDDLESPALIGLLQPTVLLPRWLVDRDVSTASEWALRHELAHWRCLDPLAILVRDIAGILFFFHPLVPLVARRQSEAMEMACDWESLRDPSEASEYAEGLCTILESIGIRRAGSESANALAMATHGRMARRIAALLNDQRARPLTPRSAVGLGLTALLVFTIGCGISRDERAGVETAEREQGGKTPTQGMESSVLDGLRWLLRHQNSDGSWSSTTVAEHCPCDAPIYNPPKPYGAYFDEGLTALALLGFLGAGFGDDSQQIIVDTATDKRYVAGAAVESGLLWLVGRQNADGSFGPNPAFLYVESLACLALTEAYGLTRNPRWKEAAQKAIDFVQRAQRPNPSGQGLWGWRYASREQIERYVPRDGQTDEAFLKDLHDSDTSSTGWCMLALESGKHAGLDVGQDHLDGGLAFVKFATAEETGLVGYLDRRGAGAKVTGANDHFTYHPATMSALGMSIRMSVEQDYTDVVLDRSAQVIAKDPPTISPDKLSIDYYYWYHASLALNRFDGPDASSATGKYWAAWSKALNESVLALQDHTKRDCRNGGWLVADRWTYQGGPIYTTALNVLTLQGYYRYDNALGHLKKK